MTRAWSLTVLAALLGAATAAAQQPNAARFRWQTGQVLTYRVEQHTAVTETAPDEKEEKPVTTETVTKLSVTKRWQVAAVDANGVATLNLSIAAMRLETKRPNGETEVFDSAKPGAAPEQTRYIGQVIAVLRIDAQGRLVEVKESKFGPASRFAADLPFKLTLPDAGPAKDQSWERAYGIKLEPPHGTGESYDATQKYTCKGVTSGMTVVGMTTSLKAPPSEPGDMIPLLPMQQEGDLYFHPQSGRYIGARLKVKKEIANHQGENSKYVYVSSYAEDLVEGR